MAPNLVNQIMGDLHSILDPGLPSVPCTTALHSHWLAMSYVPGEYPNIVGFQIWYKSNYQIWRKWLSSSPAGASQKDHVMKIVKKKWLEMTKNSV
jgi:hypothetical protein